MGKVNLIFVFVVIILCWSCINKQKLSESSLQAVINSKTNYDISSFSNYFNLDQKELKLENDEYLLGKEKMEGQKDIEIRKFPKNEVSFFLFYFKGNSKYFYKYDILNFDKSKAKEWEIPVSPK